MFNFNLVLLAHYNPNGLLIAFVVAAASLAERDPLTAQAVLPAASRTAAPPVRALTLRS